MLSFVLKAMDVQVHLYKSRTVSRSLNSAHRVALQTGNAGFHKSTYYLIAVPSTRSLGYRPPSESRTIGLSQVVARDLSRVIFPSVVMIFIGNRTGHTGISGLSMVSEIESGGTSKSRVNKG